MSLSGQQRPTDRYHLIIKKQKCGTCRQNRDYWDPIARPVEGEEHRLPHNQAELARRASMTHNYYFLLELLCSHNKTFEKIHGALGLG